jgi:hypothetical protein
MVIRILTFDFLRIKHLTQVSVVFAPRYSYFLIKKTSEITTSRKNRKKISFNICIRFDFLQTISTTFYYIFLILKLQLRILDYAIDESSHFYKKRDLHVYMKFFFIINEKFMHSWNFFFCRLQN